MIFRNLFLAYEIFTNASEQGHLGSVFFWKLNLFFSHNMDNEGSAPVLYVVEVNEGRRQSSRGSCLLCIIFMSMVAAVVVSNMIIITDMSFMAKLGLIISL